VLEKLKPEFVSPMVAYLCSEECDVSGNIYTAGGGYYGRAAILEGKGSIIHDATIENIRDEFAKISDLSGAEEFKNAFDEVSKRLQPATVG
jgi:hypothetical protein